MDRDELRLNDRYREALAWAYKTSDISPEFESVLEGVFMRGWAASCEVALAEIKNSIGLPKEGGYGTQH
jgi:hypothetical protein